MKRFGIGVGILIIVLLTANAIYIYGTDARLQSQIAEIREAGDPVTLADLIVDPIPPDQNAVVFLRRAMDDLSAIWTELEEVYEIENLEVVGLDDAQMKKVRDAFDAYPKVLPQLRQAAACEKYVPKLQNVHSAAYFIAVFAERTSKPRTAFRMLRLHVLALLAEGKREEALRDTLVMLRLSQHLHYEPTLMGHLVAVACRNVYAVEVANCVLRDGPVSADAYASLEAELATYDGMAFCRRALKTERVVIMANYREMPTRNFWIYLRGRWNSDESQCLDNITYLLDATSKPYSAVANDNVLKSKTTDSKHILAALAIPAMIRHREAADSAVAQNRCLRVLNAVLRDPNTADDKLTIDDLDLPSDATVDPFTGKPLVLTKTPDGWTVYAVGKNLEDDGGEFEDRKDVGLGPVRVADKS